MLSLRTQEAYRARYQAVHPGWQPSSAVYQAWVAAHLTPATRMLDLGCGRGGVVERLHGRARLVTGLEPDFRSLREHRTPQLALVAGRGERLPYPDRSFELVCCSWVLEHLPEPERVLAEVARVLTADGRFIFLTPNARHPMLLANRVLSRMRAGWVQRLYGRAEEDTFTALYRANTPTRLDRLATQAGLTRVALRLVGDPSYLAFNEPLFRLSCLLERVTPPSWLIHLVGEYAAS